MNNYSQVIKRVWNVIQVTGSRPACMAAMDYSTKWEGDMMESLANIKHSPLAPVVVVSLSFRR